METRFVQRLVEHRSMLHSFVYAIIRDPHLTEDILQEVAVVLWSKSGEFEEGTDFGAWARSVAFREILSARRSEARAQRHMDETCANRILAAYERRQAAVDTTSHRQALRKCLDGLGGSLREIVHGRYALGLSSRELALKFSKTAQAVDAIVYRARKILSDCVRDRLVKEGEAL